MSNAYKLWDRWPPSRNRDIVPLWHRRAHTDTLTDLGELTQVRLIKWVKIIMAIRRAEEVVFGASELCFLFMKLLRKQFPRSVKHIDWFLQVKRYNINNNRENMIFCCVFFCCSITNEITFSVKKKKQWKVLNLIVFKIFILKIRNFPFRTHFH